MTIPCWTTAQKISGRLGGPAPGGWQLLSDVTNEAEIANTLIKMYEASTVAEKFNWYESGYGREGEITLKSLGTNASEYSANDPLYSFYVDAFVDIGGAYERNVHGTFDQNPAEEYAHSLVNDLLQVEGDGKYPDGIEVESVLVTGLWMRVYHHLYDILRTCGTNNPDSRDMLDNLDKAAALWIGNKQVYGSNTAGVMLYNLAERSSADFGQDRRESRVNSDFLSVLDLIRTTITGDECSNFSDTNDFGDNVGYVKMHQLLSDAVRRMNTLLVQRLIHFLSTDISVKFTQLYTLALVPQIRACSTVDYEYFMKKVVFNTSYKHSSFEKSLARLQNMYSCLGVTCADIGSYSGSRAPRCSGNKVEPVLSLAGYAPGEDVRRFAKVDRDIRQINILLVRDNVDAAKDLYRYGRNMLIEDGLPTSLKSLAGASNRRKSGDENRLYIMFEEYYENNPEYADRLVWDAFEGTNAALQVTIPRILQTIVIPHFALRAFFKAADTCKVSNLGASAASFEFDKGAAVLVGSFEGISKGGSVDGLSWFSLTKELCTEFNCDANNSPLNVQLFKNLINGNTAIKDGNCESLVRYVSKMESILITPIIQGLLYYAKMRQEYPNMIVYYENTKVFAQAIIPLIKKVNVEQASHIESNIFNKLGDKIDAKKVWSVLFDIIKTLGIECGDIGNPNFFLNGTSFCEYTPDN